MRRITALGSTSSIQACATPSQKTSLKARTRGPCTSVRRADHRALHAEGAGRGFQLVEGRLVQGGLSGLPEVKAVPPGCHHRRSGEGGHGLRRGRFPRGQHPGAHPAGVGAGSAGAEVCGRPPLRRLRRQRFGAGSLAALGAAAAAGRVPRGLPAHVPLHEHDLDPGAVEVRAHHARRRRRLPEKVRVWRPLCAAAAGRSRVRLRRAHRGEAPRDGAHHAAVARGVRHEQRVEARRTHQCAGDVFHQLFHLEDGVVVERGGPALPRRGGAHRPHLRSPLGRRADPVGHPQLLRGSRGGGACDC
mmetsp:Transcript_171971/g.551203  ORF Transcript_171971/g.551203 Transcript_171971/m.551203 type:complete len:303 (-) Transcript_171971:541-1449(-)